MKTQVEEGVDRENDLKKERKELEGRVEEVKLVQQS